MSTINLGDIFAKPLPDGRFGLFRVVNKVEKDWQKKQYGDNAYMFVVCQRILSELPSLTDLEPEKNLYVNNLQGKEHHILAFYNTEDIPGDIIYVGNIPLSNDEKKRFRNALISSNLKKNYWEKYTGTSTDEINEFLKKQLQPAGKEFNRKDLEKLLDKTPFHVSGVDEGLKGRVNSILLNLVKNLLALEGNPSAEQISKILGEGILKLNTLDEDNEGFIETPEREQILSFFDEIVKAAGLPEFDDRDRKW